MMMIRKRVVDVATAFKSGSDYIVVGRPIKNAENRYEAAIRHSKNYSLCPSKQYNSTLYSRVTQLVRVPP